MSVEIPGLMTLDNNIRRLPAVGLMGLSSRSRVAALAERRCSLTRGSRLRCPCRSMEFTRLGNAALSRFTADAVGGLPDHDDRFAYGPVVDASSHDLLALIVGSPTQQPDAVLPVVSGYRGEFVENPPFVLLGCLLVSVPDRCHKFLLRHLADASPMWPPPEFSVTF